MRLPAINKVLVANRSEIAIRVFRACTELHKQTVAIYSEEDSLSLHRYKADEAYLVGKGKGPVEAYLDIEGILEIAKRTGADAIHPGYGFLAENAEFARRCEEEGIIFIGPTPRHLSLFGDKVAARALAQEAGLPLVPATPEPVHTLEEALRFAKTHGYPLIVKAVAGGGGRGMRVVRNRAELEGALERARSEAAKSFGNPAVFLERYIEHPKHIEVQILADQHGNMVHLFERDCSVQRRHQKVVEIAPAIALSEEKRQEICEAALRLMRRAGYVNAATVEFLYDAGGNFYFLEVNPRIQVEHTITELITGIDIVQAQIRISEGQTLAEIGIPGQEAITRRGYAIQCRITTEDPTNNFVPDRGRITAYRSAAGFGVRLDTGNGHTGAVITPYYDSLLVKVSTWALTFESAAFKMLRSLREFRIRGIKTNIPFLENVVQHPTFLKGECTTTFIDTTPELFEFHSRRDRGTKLLTFIANRTVNLPPEFKKVDKKAFRKPVVPEVSVKTPYPPGTKDILDKEGPKGLAEWVKAQKRVLLTDTTLRDAHQSLLATRMRTYDMLRIAEATAKLVPQLFSLETWGGATFDTCLRFNFECPWERLERLRALIPNICFQMLLRASNAVGYANYPDNVVREFVKEAAAAGVDIFRIFDSLNWAEGMRVAMEAALEAGKVVEAAICYTGDILDESRTKYSLKYYVELAKVLESYGAHILGIKDMAGLLKPYAAEKLIRTLKEEIGIPIHLHTHDTSGNGIATLIKAVEAGVDIVDAATSSMSGLTSQPSLGALVAALERTERDTGLDLEALVQLDEYWEVVRQYYAPFESGLKTGTPEVYVHEMPGGQYSNLWEQAKALGLEDRWKEIKRAYVAANKLMGDIVKVTPSSKAVGDLALFMVQNNLDAESLLARAEELDFPESVVAFFQGLMGQPMGGFPKELQRKVLKGREPITCRPGELLEPVDFDAVRKDLEEEYGSVITHRDVLSAVLYPSVFKSYMEHRTAYSDTSVIDTPTFFYGLWVGEETRIEIEPGKTLVIKLTAVGELLEDGTRIVYFELNGQPREVRVPDESAKVKKVERPKADRRNPGHIGASMPGNVVNVLVKEGEAVAKGQVLVVTEAMKVEQTIQAPRAGTVTEVLVKAGDSIQAGDLLLVVEPGES
ncbi:MAG: pyruvate carboxylase [Firmicutes bacterium]|nr:pyruvate carboxylase [Bacillota bacterium]